MTFSDSRSHLGSSLDRAVRAPSLLEVVEEMVGGSWLGGKTETNGVFNPGQEHPGWPVLWQTSVRVYKLWSELFYSVLLYIIST